MKTRYAFLALFLALAGCGSPAVNPSSNMASSAGTIRPFSGSTLNLRYTVTDAGVRRSLVNAGRNFQIDLRGGAYEFPMSLQMGAWSRVALQDSPVLVADFNSDGIEDEAAVLTYGTGETSVSEIVIVLSTAGTPVHTASYPLGHAEVKAISLKDGDIRVQANRRFPGDPGPRNIELVFTLPEGITGSGAIRQ